MSYIADDRVQQRGPLLGCGFTTLKPSVCSFQQITSRIQKILVEFNK